MTTFAPAIPTAAELIGEALGLPADDRIRVDITRDNWDNSWCEETGLPAAVNVAWFLLDSDGDRQWTDRALAADIAGDHITALANHASTDRYEDIEVKVSHHWVRFVHPDIAPFL